MLRGIKVCPRCLAEKPRSEFGTRKQAGGIYSKAYCRSCESNKALARNVARRAEAHEIVIIAKSRPCMDCGIEYLPRVMHFDHVWGSKSFNISVYAQHPGSIERLLDEIAKCDIVCANCHAIRTHYPDLWARTHHFGSVYEKAA